MKKVALEAKLNIRTEDLWRVLIDIKNYPRYVKFLKHTAVNGKIKVGTRWDDVTTILWIPIPVRHKIIKLDPHKEFSFFLSLPIHGTMTQTYRLKKDGKNTLVNAEISFDLGSFLENFLLGTLLEKRLKVMLLDTLENIKKSIINT